MSAEARPGPDEIPGQKLPYPARQSDMHPQPDTDLSNYRPAGKDEDKAGLITGGDSGIGRAVAVAYAMEGAAVAIVYNENDSDAEETLRMVEERGGRCLVIKADVRDSVARRDAVERTVAEFGRLNVLVNNAAFQMAQPRLNT